MTSTINKDISKNNKEEEIIIEKQNTKEEKNTKEKRANKITRVKTQYIPSFLDKDEATLLYNLLQKTIKWDDGVKTRFGGFTRKAKSISVDEIEQVNYAIIKVLNKTIGSSMYDQIRGVYLNYYRDGNDYTPNHSHPGTIQVIISLGTTRTLNIAKKAYNMGKGDVAIFGSAIHGVPREPNVKEGRISIALFIDKDPSPSISISMKELLAIYESLKI